MVSVNTLEDDLRNDTEMQEIFLISQKDKYYISGYVNGVVTPFQIDSAASINIL